MTTSRRSACVLVFGFIIFGFLAAAYTEAKIQNMTESHRRLTLYLKKSRFPIAPPKLRKVITTTTEATMKYRTRSPKPSTTTGPTTTSTTKAPPASTVVIEPEPKLLEILELSSTEERPSSIYSGISRREFLNKFPNRINSRSNLFRPPSPSTTTISPLLKLLLPRPTRPAMYSLDGFVPKPSHKFTFTTEAPNPAGSRSYRKTDLQALGSVQKKRKVKFPNDAQEDDRKKGQRSSNKKRKPNSRFAIFSRKGVPGRDFPIFESVPFTNFDCTEMLGPGMYADPDTGCQVWHMCPGGNNKHRFSFLCPNGTIFNEKKGVCDWWYNVTCDRNNPIKPRRYK